MPIRVGGQTFYTNNEVSRDLGVTRQTLWRWRDKGKIPVGDTGHRSGAEGSLALVQALGYPARDGRKGGIDSKEIVIRYFPRSNPRHRFFKSQAEIDEQATALGLSKLFEQPAK